MQFIAAGDTDIGLVKETNQDSYGVKIIQTPAGIMTLAVLCDGMGGYSKGEVASATLVHAFLKWADTRLPILCTSLSEETLRPEWNALAIAYNQKIAAYGNNVGITLGTTLTAILLTQTKYFVIHVGDSRLYQFADAGVCLTRDQTVVAREIEEGLLTEEQAKTDARRSVLLQCIGASETVVPDFFSGAVRENAVYMLCSDGFCHEITIQDMFNCLRPEVMQNQAEMMQNMRLLIDTDKQRQERDNISVVCVRTY